MNSAAIINIFKNFKNDKHTILIISLGLVGMLLVAVSFMGDDSSKEVSNTENEIEYNQLEVQNSLEKIIECIDGAGETRVMITYDTTTENVFASDSDTDKKEQHLNTKNKHIIVDGKNGETGLMLKVIYPKVRGVAVVCQGGDNPVIKEQIIDTVSALFDISSRKITVAEMAE